MAGSDLSAIFGISGSGLQAQTARMKIVAQNIANAETTPSSKGETPYQREVITFADEFDKALGAYKVKVKGVKRDTSPFLKKYDPSHPAADAEGYVSMPNVHPILESMDMREAQRSYEANLNVIDAARSMLLKVIDLLKS